jgi:hypothetical protein
MGATAAVAPILLPGSAQKGRPRDELFELVPDDAVAAGYLRCAETQAAAAATYDNASAICSASATMP